MLTEENKAIVQRFFEEVCNGRQLDVAEELFTAKRDGMTLFAPSAYCND